MRNKLINFLAILLCVISFAVISKAQSINSLVFETTFDFIIKKQTFPAGKYTVERLNPADPRLLVLREISGELKTIFLTHSMVSGKTMEESQLIFRRINESHFLTGIWVGGEINGYDILLSNKKAEENK